MLTIYAIETPKGYYISDKPSNDSYSNETILKNKLYDGIKPLPSFKSDWVFIQNKPTKVSHFEKQPNANYRFILKDDSLVSSKLPLEIKREDACNKATCGEYVWKDEWAMYSSLYELISDPMPEAEIIDEFNFVILLSCDNITAPPDFEYRIKDRYDSYSHKDVEQNISNRNLHHQALEKIIFPSLLIHNTPCELNTKDTFEIVRRYVKDNIDPKVACISSDWDKSFEVSKRLPITKPYQTSYTQKGRGRKSAVSYTTISEKKCKIFVMNDTSKSFTGISEEDLKNQLDTYLKNLMEDINEPLKECPCCKGSGVIKQDGKVILGV